MAEVAAKKSINVVSSKKNSEACSVQSNNGLIDLDTITSCSNNQLITLSDDDLLLTNNTKNDINVDDKSLQELIESELALRISSTTDMDNSDVADYDVIGYIEDTEVTRSQPEITKIVLEPRPNSQDVNSEFIIAEMNHYNVIEDRYVRQNGHFSPTEKSAHQNPNSSEFLENSQELQRVVDLDGSPKTESNKFEKTDAEANADRTPATENSGQHSNIDAVENIFERDITGSTDSRGLEQGQISVAPDDQFHLDNVDGDSSKLICTMDHVVQDKIEKKVSSVDSASQSVDGISLGAEDVDSKESEYYNLLNFDHNEPKSESEDLSVQIFDTSSKTTEILDTWNPESSGDTIQVGQFSDNFDESLQQIDNPVQLESDSETLISQEQKVDVGVNNDQTAENLAELSTDIRAHIEPDKSNLPANSHQGVTDIPGAEDEGSGKIVQTHIETVSIVSEVTDESNPQIQSNEMSTNQKNVPEVFETLNKNEGIENSGRIPENEQILEGVTPSATEKCEIASTREFLEFERQVLQENNFETIENQLIQDQSTHNAEVPEILTTELTESESSQEVKKPTDIISSVEIIQTTEKNSSNESPRVFSESKYADHCFTETTGHQVQDFESWTTVEQATSDTRIKDSTEEEDGLQMKSNQSNSALTNPSDDWTAVGLQQLAPLATPDDEISDVSNKCDLHIESREEVITTTSVVTSSTTSAKNAKTTKTKKKKIEGVANSDASPGLTPRTKKTKKSKKSDPEKENISVKSSFNKFDALSKKPVLHVRSVDTGKVQQQFNSVGQNGEPNPNCRSCGKVVFQMEQTKAEGLIWHKNCFRCNQCSKQLNVDNYQSHEATLYCKAHFKELFQPKPVEESDQPIRPRKPELIIRENQPKELPPDVVRASDKPDLGLEELSALNVKSRFQVFEKTGTETSDIERSPSQVAVKRSPSILSKLARFQAKGMDIGVADESLNGIPYEESSESEEEEEETEEVETEIIKAKRSTRERPMSFSKMDDMKNRWESTSQQGRRESQREARKEEIAGIRSRLFMGKQGKMKEMYQQAVAESERVTKINAAEEIQEIQQSAHARSIKELFERGEPIAANDDENHEEKFKHQDRADEDVIAAGISKKSRSLFLELDATAAKTARPVTPVTPKTPAESTRRARDAFVGRQVSEDVVRSTDTAEEVRAQTSDISNKFKFFEAYKAPEKQRRQFRITPPRDGQVKMESPEREIYRDPEVVRADDRVDEVVHTDTARKMLSIFRQMEEKASKEDLPDGPKPLKRFTPPPEDKFAKPTASESEEEDDEEGEESEAGESGEERDPNYVRASDKVEDEFLKQAQNAARAKTLRAKFEHWETMDDKVTNHNVAEMEIAQGAGDQASIESASSLRARFESLGSQPTEAPRTAKVKVNRFVEIQTTCAEVCESCEKKVYPLEKVETNNKIFHKQCFRCLQCNCILRMDTFTLNNGKLYCIPHFKQLFITRGNYDEGFGINPHKNKWASSNASLPAMQITTNTPTPIAVSNGDH